MPNYLIRNAFSQLQRRFLQSSATSSPIPPLIPSAASQSSFTVQFLVNSCGIPLKSALSVSKKLQLNEKAPEKPQSVLRFLKSHDFSETLIAQLIVKRPLILTCGVESKLRSKFDYLIEKGFQGELLHHVIVSAPDLMKTSLDSRIKPSFEFLRLFCSDDEQLVLAVKRYPALLTRNLKNSFQKNVEILVKEGVPVHTLGRFLSLLPRSMFLKPESVVDTLNSVKSLGVECAAPVFIHAFRVMSQLSESTWREKIRVFQSFGFGEDDVLRAFKAHPYILGISEAKIRKGLDFYSKTMKLDPQTIVVNPSLLGYSIEKRVRPRLRILKVLESKKLIEVIVLKSFMVSEGIFRKRFIDRFKDEVPGLLELYLGVKTAATWSSMEKSGVSFPLQNN